MRGVTRLFHVKHDLPPIAVSASTALRLETYAALIREWSPTINLVAKADLPELLHRHIDDCLQLLSLLPAVACVHVDVGSGAGLPGLVLAVAGNRHVHLVESDRRKAAFLRHAARVCGANVTVHPVRIEEADTPPADVITARAVAPLPQLLDWTVPHLAPGGRCVFSKGRTAEHELTQATGRWHMQTRRWVSQTDPEATILELSELTRR